MPTVLRYDAARLEDLRAFLLKGGFALDRRPHAHLFATRPGVSLTAYESGKLLLTGAQEAEYAGVLLGNGLAREEPASAPTASAPGAEFAPHVGSDESGKGDYFGPLAVAAVHVDSLATARFLVEKGVRDSKTVGDAAIGPLASLVRLRCPHATVVIAPPRYNEVYERFGSLNRMLAWAHAAAIEEVLGKAQAAHVVVDQFAEPRVLESALREKGRAVDVRQMVRGESDVAVAAASILARAEFLAGLAALSARHGHVLPRGAGAPVVKAAREIGARGGEPALRQVAKLHFATTRGALGLRDGR